MSSHLYVKTRGPSHQFHKIVEKDHKPEYFIRNKYTNSEGRTPNLKGRNYVRVRVLSVSRSVFIRLRVIKKKREERRAPPDLEVDQIEDVT